MKVKFSGDFANLKKFADKISRSPEVLNTVSEQLAEETIGLIREGFENSKDPYGNAWDPPLLRNGKPLEDTGGLKAAWFKRHVDRSGFSVANAKAYASYQQEGTGLYGPRKQRIRPKNKRALSFRVGSHAYAFRSVKGAKKRRMVPDSGSLPAAWKRRFRQTAHDVLTEIFR